MSGKYDSVMLTIPTMFKEFNNIANAGHVIVCVISDH